MNRYRLRFAPNVWTPKLSPTLVNWLRPFRLRRQQRDVGLSTVDVVGDSIVREQLDAGHGVLIMPNHSSHADPYTIYAAADRIGTALHVMATWHVFYNQPYLVQRFLRWHGCFSVDREANDIGAFRLACGILQQKREPLVIFPEGEIYHCNDRVTPFREGAAAIAVTAARKADRTIVCVPCAITYRYIEDPTEMLESTMGDLEEAIFWRRQDHQPLDQRIYQFAKALLAVKELEYFQETQAGNLPERIRALGDHILDGVEKRHELDAGQHSVPERIKAARRAIMVKRDEIKEDEKAKKTLDDDLEDLFLVVQSFSYPGDYVQAKPSIERMAETIDKFEEDVLHRPTASIRTQRSATVQFAEAIEIPKTKVKGLATTVTAEVEKSVQSMLAAADR